MILPKKLYDKMFRRFILCSRKLPVGTAASVSPFCFSGKAKPDVDGEAADEHGASAGGRSRQFTGTQPAPRAQDDKQTADVTSTC